MSFTVLDSLPDHPGLEFSLSKKFGETVLWVDGNNWGQRLAFQPPDRPWTRLDTPRRSYDEGTPRKGKYPHLPGRSFDDTLLLLIFPSIP